MKAIELIKELEIYGGEQEVIIYDEDCDREIEIRRVDGEDEYREFKAGEKPRSMLIIYN
jgi:hypothetical protein